MASRQGQPLEKVLAMAKGDGEDSYSNNSLLQSLEVTKFALPELEKALDKLSLPEDGRVVLADLGCSSGPNTIRNLAFIANELRRKLSASSLPSPEIQAFFNDLPSNDFNNLFKLLSSDTRNCAAKDFFAAGLPGSFYGRLFPRSSVNVFFSSHCLHWISEVPVTRGTDAEKEFAVQKQSAADLKVFLESRAAELVPGGLLFLYFGGRTIGIHDHAGDDRVATAMYNCMAQVWSDLISQGVITQEQRDEFVIPLYFRTSQEVKEGIESCSSEFEVHTLKLLETSDKRFADALPSSDPTVIATKVLGVTRGALGPIVEAHFGSKAANIFWQRVEKKVVDEVPFTEDLISNRKSWRHCVALICK